MNKVLIIEDDPAALSLLKDFLLSKGLDVSTAVDGLEGLEKVKALKPDLILLDVMMPKLDGYGFVRELKKIPDLRAMPIIVLTAREMMRDVFVQEGVKHFITKPYDPAELYKTVQKYLQ